ncbi:MAG: AAA family ATPase [Treponema sp.]|nr:AAA family ATPase [Treponema sp.]
MDLFDVTDKSKEPLASRMRPRSLDEYIGQDHIVGKGRLLRRAIQADRLTSVIFYGPPGTGKTTLARVIANHTKSNFITLNAVLTGVADIRTAIAEADNAKKLYSKKTILFVDEVHRWNKSQQDALLPWVENGTIILIGATTENPFFEVNKALVSRSRVFQLKPLEKEDLMKAAKQALTDKERGYGNYDVVFEKGALEHLVDTANGDARSLLNALELAVETTVEKWPAPKGTQIYISKESAEESIQKKVVLYDRDGDYHYDIISAFIKSLRGRDPDAALYWLARMVRAGEDPDFIFRRMLISACEDTGMADPYAISVIQSCAASFDRVGLPEGRYFLAHAALYLSTAPKSNSSMAFFDALAAVEKEDVEVPNHLKDNSRDAEGFGHGKGYMYPHAYKDHWVAQQYLPNELVGRVFYNPTDQGYEKNIKEDVLSRRELQISAILEKTEAPIPQGKGGMHKLPELASDFSNPIGEWWINKNFKTGMAAKEEELTFSPVDNDKEKSISRAERDWRKRLESNRAQTLLTIRDSMIHLATLNRHTRSLIWNADDGLLLWQVTRNTPEGLTCGLCKNERNKAIIEQYGNTLDEIDRPKLSMDIKDFNDLEFDRIFFRDVFKDIKSIEEKADFLKDTKILSKDFATIISQHIPKNGQHFAKLIKEQIKHSSDIDKILDKMIETENQFFNDKSNALFAWDNKNIKETFENKGFKVDIAIQTVLEKRRITTQDLSNWFNSQTSAYGKVMLNTIGKEKLQLIVDMLSFAINRQIFDWQTEIAFARISNK